jgi:hypothetical protein
MSLAINPYTRAQQEQQIKAATEIVNESMTDKVINNAGWAIYVPALLISGGYVINNMSNPVKIENYNYIVITSIILLIVNIAYAYTYFNNKDINKYLNYIAFVPIFILVLVIAFALLTTPNRR